MKIAAFINKSLCLVLSITILFAFSACAETNGVSTKTEYEKLTGALGTDRTETNGVFTKTEGGILI